MAKFDVSTILPILIQKATACCIIAIDGPGCAGKTTLATQLADHLGAIVVHFDDFYRVLDPHFREGLTPEQGYESYFDWERLRSELLIPLSKGQAGNFLKYDWHKNALGESLEKIHSSELLIVEGVYSCRPELRPYYSHTIFVKLPGETRKRRAEERGENTSFWIERWMAAENFYLAKVNPESAADWVFDGETGVLVSAPAAFTG